MPEILYWERPTLGATGPAKKGFLTGVRYFLDKNKKPEAFFPQVKASSILSSEKFVLSDTAS